MTSPELKKYLRIAKRLSDGMEVPRAELKFFAEFAPQVDQATIDEANRIIRNGEMKEDGLTLNLSAEQLTALAQQKLQDPIHREKLLSIAEDKEAIRSSERLQQGLNLILGGVDIAQSAKQIKAGEELAKRSKRPSRPAIPQRDIYLQQALRDAEVGTMDAARALAPVEAQIYDQYLSDVNDAKTASGGQLGAYGSYRQLAANRRNRAALNLAPIADEMRRGQQARYDNLLGMRMDETQDMFRNAAYLYPHDLNQYSENQKTAAGLSSTGRENMRASLYNMGYQGANFIGQNATKRKYDRLRNQMAMYGDNVANAVVDSRRDLEGNLRSMSPDDTAAYWEQMY